MISVEAQVTGGQIGRALRDDPEEMAYCLTELASHRTSGFAADVAEYAMTDLDQIVILLRELATAFEKEAVAVAASAETPPTHEQEELAQ